MEYAISFLILSILVMWLAFAVPITTRTGGFYRVPIKQKLPFWEVFGIVVFGAVLGMSIIGFGMHSEGMDQEVWNGQVTGKAKERTSCEHSYSCNCRPSTSCSGSGTSRSCSTTTVCDTCYEHSHDYNWTVHSTIDNFYISRIDRQGNHEPPRWTQVAIKDPVSKVRSFNNYIKGAHSNVLNRAGTKITFPMPAYPLDVYDYYKISRTINVDTKLFNPDVWDYAISSALRELGPSKQLNMVFVFTKNPEEYADQLNAAWLGGKKNDVITVIGTQDGKTPDWVRVLSWSRSERFKVDIREAVMEMALEPGPVVRTVGNILEKQFNRREMAEFEYLQYDAVVPFWYALAAYLAFLFPLIGYFLVKKGILS